MKKIGIITINDFNNYGNRLQCYALQHFLKKMGCTAENIYNENHSGSVLIRCGKQLIRQLRNVGNGKIVSRRQQSFRQFNQSIRFSEERILNGQFREDLNERYDLFITGSDQVWNPLDSGRSEIDFLSFASDHKKIAFSASIGVERLPDGVGEKYRQYLLPFKKISVREESAQRIVEELTGRKDIEVLVDPTMLLTAREWEAVSQRPDFSCPARFILTYFLGGAGKWEGFIRRLAEEHCCEIIDIYDRNSVFYSCGPQHFLALVKDAFLICTDSFHAAVFSFLFNRPFIVFDREHAKIDMNSRMDTLLTTFNLQQSRYDVNREPASYLRWDYSEGYQILQQEREKARRFLQQALS